MDQQPTSRGGPLYWLQRRSRKFWIIVAALLPVFYVASFGPACWMVRNEYLSNKTVAHAYRPLLRYAGRGYAPTWLHELLVLYAGRDEFGGSTWVQVYLVLTGEDLYGK